MSSLRTLSSLLRTQRLLLRLYLKAVEVVQQQQREADTWKDVNHCGVAKKFKTTQPRDADKRAWKMSVRLRTLRLFVHPRASELLLFNKSKPSFYQSSQMRLQSLTSILMLCLKAIKEHWVNFHMHACMCVYLYKASHIPFIFNMIWNDPWSHGISSRLKHEEVVTARKEYSTVTRPIVAIL